MRTFGLLLPYRGASADYFRRELNQEVQRRGSRDSAAPVMAVHFDQADDLLAEEKWWTLTQHLKRYVYDLAATGVEGLVLGSLTWYRFAPEIMSDVGIPLLHPADALDREITRRTESQSQRMGIIAPSLAIHPGPLFDRLARNGHRPLVLPGVEDAPKIDILVDELNRGAISRVAARQFLRRVMADLRQSGARAITVGTPELTAILAPDDVRPDCYDLPAIQVAAIADWMLASRPRLSP